MGDRPPRIPTSSGSDPERLERGPQCSSRRRKFRKLLHTIVVLRIGYIPTRRNYTSSLYPQCPMQKKQKTAIFGQLGVVFESWWRGITVFGGRCNFTSVTSSPHAELKYCVRVFDNIAYELRYRGVSADLSRDNQKIGLFRGHIWKLGGKILPSKKIF